MSNLELWGKVEKTNPNYTKKANVKGNNITSIAPQYQIMNATSHFGIYGVAWGFKNIEIDYTLTPICGLVYWKATFFFPNGEFPATNSISVWRDGAQTKPDDQFAKKVETDSLTKCLSKLGFNADIFMGKFDDDRYLEEVTKEFNPPAEKKPPTIKLHDRAAKDCIAKKLPIKTIKEMYIVDAEQEVKLKAMLDGQK